jgi:hypothetical protein
VLVWFFRVWRELHCEGLNLGRRGGCWVGGEGEGTDGGCCFLQNFVLVRPVCASLVAFGSRLMWFCNG